MQPRIVSRITKSAAPRNGENQKAVICFFQPWSKSGLARRSVNKTAKGQWLVQVPFCSPELRLPSEEFLAVRKQLPDREKNVKIPWPGKERLEISAYLYPCLNPERYAPLPVFRASWNRQGQSVVKGWFKRLQAKVTQINRQQRGTQQNTTHFQANENTKQTGSEQLVELLWGAKHQTKAWIQFWNGSCLFSARIYSEHW